MVTNKCILKWKQNEWSSNIVYARLQIFRLQVPNEREKKFAFMWKAGFCNRKGDVDLTWNKKKPLPVTCWHSHHNFSNFHTCKGWMACYNVFIWSEVSFAFSLCPSIKPEAKRVLERAHINTFPFVQFNNIAAKLIQLLLTAWFCPGCDSILQSWICEKAASKIFSACWWRLPSASRQWPSN